MAPGPNPFGRRTVIKQLATAILGFFGWRTHANAREGNDAIFAQNVLRDTPHVRLKEGYYDPVTQVYMDKKTGKPMFVSAADQKAMAKLGSEGAPLTAMAENSRATKKLSEKELDELLKNGRFVDFKQLQKVYASGLPNTWSRMVSLSTTGPCCPIITDQASDLGPDDPGTF